MTRQLRFGIASAALGAAVLGGVAAALPETAQADGARSGTATNRAVANPDAVERRASPPAVPRARPEAELTAAGGALTSNDAVELRQAPESRGAAEHRDGARPAQPRTAPGREPSWRNSAQFQEIKSGRNIDGTVLLLVRPAKKEILGESFRTVPVPGPYTEVTLVENARILHLDGESGSPEAFLDSLARRAPNRSGYLTPDEREQGFGLTYDARGRVTQVEWLYVP